MLTQPAQLSELLGVPFTPEQLAAATAPREPAVIIAGAGSGKTSVMAARVVWLVGTGQVRPDGVLGLTFTNKAAGELAQRIRAALARAELGQETGSDGGEPVVSTYHAFAGRLVTDHGLRLGIEPQSRLLVDASRFQLAARVLRSHTGAIHHLTRPLRMIVGDLISLESEMSEHLVSSVEVIEQAEQWLVRIDAELQAVTAKGGRNKTQLADLDRYRTTALGRIELAGLVEEYRAAKTALDAVDFGDQVALAARLAEESPAAGELERAAAGVVLLDEYQDTSVAQRRMLRGLFGGGHPVTAVGDPCQAIYGWRGASVANLDDFPLHFTRADGSPGGTYSLAVNQRSGGRLLQLANTVAAPLLARHRVTELRPRPGREDHGCTVVALHETWARETAWVAEQLAERVAAGQAPGECAVLVRSRVDIADLYAALIRAGLPVEVVGLGGLLSLPEVADVVATLEVLDDPTANGALIRLLSGPRHRLGVRDLVALGRRAQELMRTPGMAPVLAEQQSLFGAATEGEPGMADFDGDDEEALKRAVAGVDPCDITALSDALTDLGEAADCGMSEDAAVRCRRLGSEIGWLRRHLDEPLLDLVHRVVNVLGLDVEIAATPGAAASRRQETLATFLDIAAGFRDLDGQSSLTAFLAFLAAAQEHERGLDSTSPSGADAVSLLTAHKAKGLEWDVVVVPNLTNKVFPVDRLQGQWPRDIATLPSPLRGDASSLPVCGGAGAAALKSFDAESREHLLREELRLGYVAFTRPRHELIASGHWWGPTQKKPRGPSPFLLALKDHAEAEGETPRWADQPPDGAVNPQLDEMESHPWPAPLDPAALAERERAADLVRRQLAGAPLPPATDLTPAEQRLFAELDADIEALVKELRADRPAVRLVELPSTLTATQLMRLRVDPDELAREMLRPMPRRPVPAARRGTRFHAWIESLFEQRPLLDPGDLPGASDELIGTDEDLLELQEAFLAGPFAARQPCAVEAPFALAIAGRVVRGRIDAVYDLGGGRWEVVDWKTGHEIADPLQLAVYRCAWAELRGIDLAADPAAVSGAFVYVKDGRVSRPTLPGSDELAALLAPTESVPAAG